MANPAIASQVAETWARASTGWRGAPATGYYKDYILRMQENAERFDTACVRLGEATRILESGLAALERSMDD